MLRHEDENPEVLRLAVRLHEEARERQVREAAERDALREMEIPEGYLQEARNRVLAREAAQQEHRRNLRIAFAAFLPITILFAAFVGFIAMRPPSTPISEPFDATAITRWSLDANPETRASAKFEGGQATVRVERFGVNEAGESYATLNTIDGAKNVRTLHTVSFRAKGTGLSRVRLRFVRGDDSWVTGGFLLTPNWTTYRVSMDRLTRYQRKGDGYRERRAGHPASTVDSIQFQFGQHVNPPNERGEVSLKDLRLR